MSRRCRRGWPRLAAWVVLWAAGACGRSDLWPVATLAPGAGAGADAGPADHSIATTTATDLDAPALDEGRPDEPPLDAPSDGSGDAHADAGAASVPPLPPVCSPDEWCWDYPRPSGDSFRAVAGTGPDDVWIGGPFVIAHWDGTIWRSWQTASTVSGIWAASREDAWAVAGQALLRWDGQSWSDWSLQQDVAKLLRSDLGDWHFNALWGASRDDVWAVGEYYHGGNFGIVLHWDGTAWTNWITQRGLGDPYAALRSIWGSSADDVWLAGTASQRSPSGVVLHWDGRSLTDAGVPARGYLFALGGSAADDVWAAGATDGQYGYAMFHWDGQAWSDFSPRDTYAANHAVYGLWASSPDDVWAVGYGPTVMHWNGQVWASRGGDSPGLRILWATWGSSAGDLWAVGTDGRIIHWDAGLPDPMTSDPPWRFLRRVWGSAEDDVWAVGANILHGDGSSWSTSVLADDATFNDVWGWSRDDVWTVGYSGGTPSGGVILHWDGASWSSADLAPGLSLASFTLNAIWGAAPDDVWAAGASLLPSGNGTTAILHWNGNAWSDWIADNGVTTLGASALSAMWGAAANDIWAVGSSALSPFIVHWDGATWARQDTSGLYRQNAGLSAIWGAHFDDVWAVGSGPILHWDGASWSEWKVGAQWLQDYQALNGVWGSSPADVWAVGTKDVYQSQMLHFDGHAWIVAGLPTEGVLYGIGGSGARRIWAVGNNGILRRLDPGF